MARVWAVVLLTVRQELAALGLSIASVPTNPRLQWADDEMRSWKPYNMRKVPESIPGSSAFLTWSDLFKRSGDLADETETLKAQQSRFITPAELEHEKGRVMNGEAGRSRTHPLGSAATMNCGASPNLRLSYSGGQIHYEDTTSTYPTTVDIPLQTDKQLFEPSSDILSVFRDKWIYIQGDSTTRQQCQHFVGAMLNVSVDFEDFKDCVRNDGSTCPNTDLRNNIEQPRDWEFLYKGPGYGANEHTLTMYVRRLNTTLTCDWKMHAFRRYDRWLLKQRFQLEAPDLYIVSAGLHDCFWAGSLNMGGAYHALQAETFLEYLNAFLPDKTKFIWLSAQQSISLNYDQGQCIKSINGAARQSAAKHSVAFVDRENFTSEIANMVNDNHKIRCHVSNDGIHLKPAFTEITFRYLSEASRCLLRN
jgi:hypothetical protein